MGLHRRNRKLAAAFGCIAAFIPGATLSCELALVFAVDVSGSVNGDEFQIQMRGLAAGIKDGVISEALVKSEAAVSLVQWTGSSRQIVSIPWFRVDSFENVDVLAGKIEAVQRRWRMYSTAIGEAVVFSASMFDQVPDCRRKVIDVSGDGISNEGVEPLSTLSQLRQENITVNALVIEGVDQDLTGYFWENVITGPGSFVVTADGFGEYAAKMRIKLLREAAKQVSNLADPHQ